MKGYSSRFIKAIEAADTNKLGVQLAKVCIAKDIPVTDVADFFKVTRMTVYNWFKGVTKVPDAHTEKVEKLVAKLQM